MPDDKAGVLLKTILSYVNDENPEVHDLMVDLVFEPIKHQLKRDLREWELKKSDRTASGQLGNLKRWHPDLYQSVMDGKLSLADAILSLPDRTRSQPNQEGSETIANIAVNGNVNGNVNESVRKIPSPSLTEFLDYAKFMCPQIRKDYRKIEPALTAKYHAWKESGWINGMSGKPIKNWKSTLLNTIPNLRESDETELKPLKAKRYV